MGFLKKEIKTSTGLIAIFGAAVLLFGGALTYYYRMAPTTYDYEVQSYPIPSKTTTADATKDWKTYEIKDLGLSFKYPNEWGDVKISTQNGTTGTSNVMTFSQLSGDNIVSMGYTTTDFSAERGGSIFEGAALNNPTVNYVNCESFKKSSSYNKSAFLSCKDIVVANKTVGLLISEQYPEGEMLAGPFSRGYYLTGLTKYPVIGMSVAKNNAITLSNLESLLESFKVVVKQTSTTATATSTPATSAAWKSYVNTDFGFGLTFTDAWEGYKLKPVDLEGTIKTFYVNVPTSDPIYAAETSTAYAGYAAPFVISVINKSEWQDDEIFARDFGSKVGEKGNYVFTSSQWQACPTDLCSGGISSSLKTVMDSFKVL